MPDYTVRVFKLINGQELIGKTHPTELLCTFYTMEDVRLVTPMQTPDGFTLTLAPYYFISPDGKIKLHKDAIASELVEVPKVVENEYLSAVSGIKIVTASPGALKVNS